MRVRLPVNPQHLSVMQRRLHRRLLHGDVAVTRTACRWGTLRAGDARGSADAGYQGQYGTDRPGRTSQLDSQTLHHHGDLRSLRDAPFPMVPVPSGVGRDNARCAHDLYPSIRASMYRQERGRSVASVSTLLWPTSPAKARLPQFPRCRGRASPRWWRADGLDDRRPPPGHPPGRLSDRTAAKHFPFNRFQVG